MKPQVHLTRDGIIWDECRTIWEKSKMMGFRLLNLHLIGKSRLKEIGS